VARTHRLRRWLAAFWTKAYEDGLTGLAAMVAYNLLLSVFPFALIALFVAARVLQSPEVEASLLEDLKRVFPAAAESTLSEGVRRLQDTSTTVGIVALVGSVWIGASFWGSLDTAFCRIYHCECRTWVRQKLFALGMLGVSLLFVVATVAVPAVQALLVSGTKELPLGLDSVRGLVYWITLAAGVAGLFTALCATYWYVPKERMPWDSVWPGALGATIAMAIVDLGFPLYLDNISALRLGTSALFVLIALVWFYVLALILLAGAVVNELRHERRRLSGMPDPTTEGMRLDQIEREREEHARARAAGEDAERHQHEKRADKAAYLEQKLAERGEAEDRAEREDAAKE